LQCYSFGWKKRTDTKAAVESLGTQLWLLSGIPSSWTQHNHSLTLTPKLSGFLFGTSQLMDSLICRNTHEPVLNQIFFQTSML